MEKLLFVTIFDGYKIEYYEKSCKIYGAGGEVIRTPHWHVTKDFTLVLVDFNQQWSYSDKKEIGMMGQKIWNSFKEQYASLLLEKSLTQG